MSKELFRTPGNRVNENHPACKEKWIQAGKLKKGQYIKIALGNLVDSFNMSFDTAWLIGAMVGDGYIRKAGNSFTSSDIGVTQKMNDSLKIYGGDLKKRTGNNFGGWLVSG